MGANAQTAVPDFTAGQVLTAAQMTEVNTGIPVFADSSARDAAFGGAGEKVLAEGQYAYIEATNTTQFYDGSVWQPVGTQSVVLIETLTPSAAATAQFTTGSFSSTYSHYSITFNLNNTFSVNLRSAGSTITAANYGRFRYGVNSASNALLAVTGSETVWPLINVSTGDQYPFNGTIDTMSIPTTSGKQVLSTIVQNQFSGSTNAQITNVCVYTANQAYDSLLFTGVSGNLTGTIKLYGWV
jgi:hypothetical protein